MKNRSLHTSTNNGNIECAYHLKSYLLCQTILATANGQIAKSHYVCDLSCHRKSCYVRNTIASVMLSYAALHHATLRCIATHVCSLSVVFMCCRSNEIPIYISLFTFWIINKSTIAVHFSSIKFSSFLALLR